MSREMQERRGIRDYGQILIKSFQRVPNPINITEFGGPDDWNEKLPNFDQKPIIKDFLSAFESNQGSFLKLSTIEPQVVGNRSKYFSGLGNGYFIGLTSDTEGEAKIGIYMAIDLRDKKLTFVERSVVAKIQYQGVLPKKQKI